MTAVATGRRLITVPGIGPALSAVLIARLPELGHGIETARCAGYAADLNSMAASGSRPFCSALI